MNSLLPIEEIREPILESLRKGNRLVVIAPTGSGKTTQVPQYLLDGGVLSFGQRMVVLQPRRVAARSVAARVAREREGKLGEEVGYQIRFDDSTTQGTRISYVTEGILLRWLQTNPTLEGVGVLVFDEFHERNLRSDVALALAKGLQRQSRPDLKIVVMSATLEAQPVADYLGDCPVLVSEGRMFPVEVEYLPHGKKGKPQELAAQVVQGILQKGLPGDVLVFMPGMREIQLTLREIQGRKRRDEAVLIPLHGDLSPEEQDLAFADFDQRKIVVATNVAETSITIDGIGHVVDSGLARVARFDAERGITVLQVEEISRVSADQRKGRAGRTGPGTCHRLWTKSGHLNRPERNTPEIQRADLAEVVLLLHSLGIRKATEFDWLDRPDTLSVERAEWLLEILGALDRRSGRLTTVGEEMLRLPMHPRLSRMLVEARTRGCLPAATLCASLVSGRDLLLAEGRLSWEVREARELFQADVQSDFFTLMRAFLHARRNRFSLEVCRRFGINAQTAVMVQQTHEQIRSILATQFSDESGEEEVHLAASSVGDEALLRSIMTGFIDHLCVRRGLGTLECDMTEGRSGTLTRESMLASNQASPLFVAGTIREISDGSKGGRTLLGLATAVKLEWMEEIFPEQLSCSFEHVLDRTHKRVAAVQCIRFHDLLLHYEHVSKPDPAASGQCLAEAFEERLFELPRLTHELRQLMARSRLVAFVLPELEFPRFEREDRVRMLARAFHGMTLIKEAQAVPLENAVREAIGAERMEWLEELAPARISWPAGRSLKLTYNNPPYDEENRVIGPDVQVKLHECFQLDKHPLLLEGKVPVRIRLQAPNGKNIEITEDWPGFKAERYPKLRPELMKKFPSVTWI